MDQILKLLHKDTGPDTRLYAVVDVAKAVDDVELRTIINQPSIQKMPLFSYELALGEFDVSPCLIRLDHHQEIKKQLIIRGWGKKWSMFLTSDADTETLLTHLKIILHPLTGNGRPLIFRFYDPVILSDYLPLLTPVETAGFFGPVKRFIVESENGQPQEFKRPKGAYDPAANYVHGLDHEKIEALNAAVFIKWLHLIAAVFFIVFALVFIFVMYLDVKDMMIMLAMAACGYAFCWFCVFLQIKMYDYTIGKMGSALPA